MANEEFITQYNQLIWQMDQLRAEANEAGEAYASKLKAIAKRMRHVTGQLELVGRELSRRQVPIGPVAPVMATSTSPVAAGFHPQG